MRSIALYEPMLETSRGATRESPLQYRFNRGSVRIADQACGVLGRGHIVLGIAGETFGEGAEVEDAELGGEHDDNAFRGFDDLSEDRFAPLLFGCEALSLGDPFQAFEKRLGAKRLDQIIGGAFAERGDRAFELRVSGDDNYRGVGTMRSQAGQELIRRHVGKITVENNRPVFRPIAPRKSVRGGVRRIDAVTGHLEHVDQIGALVGVVLDRQDPAALGLAFPHSSTHDSR